jgi:tRNA dimethylallyltransferase
VRGLFPGPARDDRLRARLERVARIRGVDALYRWLTRVDPASSRRIQPRDLKRLVRALEVYLLSGQTMTAHFEATVSPIADFRVLTIGLQLPKDVLLPRVTRRVDAQFDRGVVEEVEHLMSIGVPADAHALSGLVYRQVREMLAGARDRAATRDLIIRENMQYARRQLVWFRGEPGVRWLEGAGESEPTTATAVTRVRDWLDASQ